MRTMTPPRRDPDQRPRREVVALKAMAGAVTLLGRTVLGLSVLAWMLGWWLGWNEYMLVAAGCLVAPVAAVLFTLGRASLEVGLELEPERLVVGEQAVGRILVTNGSGRMFLPVAMEAPVGKGVARVDVPALAAGRSFEQVFVVPTLQRSVVTVGPVSSVRGDPLGLAR